MGLAKRICPTLHIKGPNLVKGIHLEGLRVLGHPGPFAQKYYEGGADELIYIDTVASLYGRNNLHDIISEAVKNVFIPVSVGGGIRSVEDARSLFRCGVEKVIINTAITKRPKLITEISEVFGSQAMCVYIEARKCDSKYEVLTDNGREETGRDVYEWVEEIISLGAGEIFVTSVDRDGTGSGYDLELIRGISSLASIPVIAHGGAGIQSHIGGIFIETETSAVGISSMLHYNAIEAPEGKFTEGNLEFVKGKRGAMKRNNIEPTDIKTIKQYLHKEGIECRMSW